MIHVMDGILMCGRPDRSRNTGSPSEPIICDLKETVTEGFTVPETVITK